MVHTGVRRQRQRSRPTCARQQRSALAHLQAEAMSASDGDEEQPHDTALLRVDLSGMSGCAC